MMRKLVYEVLEQETLNKSNKVNENNDFDTALNTEISKKISSMDITDLGFLNQGISFTVKDFELKDNSKLSSGNTLNGKIKIKEVEYNYKISKSSFSNICNIEFSNSSIKFDTSSINKNTHPDNLTTNAEEENKNKAIDEIQIWSLNEKEANLLLEAGVKFTRMGFIYLGTNQNDSNEESFIKINNEGEPELIINKYGTLNAGTENANDYVIKKEHIGLIKNISDKINQLNELNKPNPLNGVKK